MCECIVVDVQKGGGNVISSNGEIIANDASMTLTVHKRPRGRPRLSKSLQGLSGGLSDARDYPDTSYAKRKHSMGESPDDADNRTTQLSKSLTEAIRKSNQKRARGRPRGSVNKKGRHSLDALVSDTRKQNTSDGLGPESERNSQCGKKRRSSRTFMPSVKFQYSPLNKKKLKPLKKSRGRPPGVKNKLKLLNMHPDSIDDVRRKFLNLSAETLSVLRQAEHKENSIQSSDERKIPQHRFNEAEQILKNPEHSFWHETNVTCTKSIHRFWEEKNAFLADQKIRLKMARQFLMRRDWKNLLSVLNISLRDGVCEYNAYYTLFTRYAALSLVHTDKQQFNKFMQFLLKTEDGGKILKKCSQFSQNYLDEEERIIAYQ